VEADGPLLLIVAALPLLAALSCAAGAPDQQARVGSGPAPAARPAAPEPEPAAPAGPQSGPRPPTGGPELGPTLLLPDPDSADDEVDRIGGRSVRKHHVYDRFVELEPLRAAEVRELVAMDLMVAEDARRAGITVARSDVDATVDGELGRIRRRFDAELGSRMTFAGFLAREYGLDEAGYRARIFRSVARARLRERTVRFASWQQERVSCRFLVTSDEKVAQEVRAKVIAGADLEVLARRHSEDDSRESGGKLPPFGPDLSHPVAEIAFGLAEGACSPVVARSEGGRDRYYVVHCLRRLPARTGSYQDLEAEVIRDLETTPMTTFESTAFYVGRRRLAVAPDVENR
jgi:hypothetical protein